MVVVFFPPAQDVSKKKLELVACQLTCSLSPSWAWHSVTRKKQHRCTKCSLGPAESSVLAIQRDNLEAVANDGRPALLHQFIAACGLKSLGIAGWPQEKKHQLFCIMDNKTETEKTVTIREDSDKPSGLNKCLFRIQTLKLGPSTCSPTTAHAFKSWFAMFQVTMQN